METLLLAIIAFILPRNCHLVIDYILILGTCPNGTEAVGCGPQEEFRACADITITEADGTADESPNTLVTIHLKLSLLTYDVQL